MENLHNLYTLLELESNPNKVVQYLAAIEEIMAGPTTGIDVKSSVERLVDILGKHRHSLNCYIRQKSHGALPLLLFSHTSLLDFDIKIRYLESGLPKLTQFDLCDLLSECLSKLQNNPAPCHSIQTDQAVFLLLDNIRNVDNVMEILGIQKNTINDFLLRNIRHEHTVKLYDVISSRSKILSKDVEFQCLMQKYAAMDESQQKQLLNENIDLLKSDQKKEEVMNILPKIAILFKFNNSNLAMEKEKFLQIAENHKNFINSFLKNNKQSVEFFAVLTGKMDLLEMNVIGEYIYREGIDASKAFEFLVSAMTEVNKAAPNMKLKFIPPILKVFLEMFGRNERKFMEFIEQNKEQVNNFLRQNKCEALFEKLPSNLLDYDVRILYVTSGVEEVDQQQLWNLLDECLTVLEKQDDRETCVKILQAIGVLFRMVEHPDLENARSRFVRFARRNSEILNVIFNQYFILSFGAIITTLGTAHDVLHLHLKLEKIDSFLHLMDRPSKWLLLSECLQCCETIADFSTCLHYIKMIRRSLAKNADGSFAEEKLVFVEKHKDLLNRVIYAQPKFYPTIFEIIKPFPQMLEMRNKFKFVEEFLPILDNGAKWEMVEECINQSLNRKSDKPELLEKGRLILTHILSCVEENDSARLLEISEKHKKTLDQMISKIEDQKVKQKIEDIMLEHMRSLSFEEKVKYFRRELGPQEATSYTDLSLQMKIERENIVTSSFNETLFFDAAQWKKRFRIHFVGERGIDAGGLLKEWYTIMTREIFNPNYALFTPTPGDTNSYMINKASHVNPNHLDYFKFTGKFIAKAVFEKKPINCHLTTAFYKQILGIPVVYTDFEKEDPTFFNSLDYLLKNPIESLDLDMTFITEVEEFGQVLEKELKPDGKNIQVTDENKEEYVRLLCQMKMTGSVISQINAFCNGFYEIIPGNLVKIFKEKEFETLICGQSDFNIDDLEANTVYSGYTKKDDNIKWFWQALRSFEKIDRTRLLMFVTASSNAPLDGFSSYFYKFKIVKDIKSGKSLPTAHTCFNQLFLPQYDTYENLHKALLTAVREGSEGFRL